MNTTLTTTDLQNLELNRAQVANILDFSAAKIASYNSSEGRWLSFFPGLEGSRGRYRYYRVPDVMVMAMLIDTMPSKESGLSHPIGTEFRHQFADGIRKYLPAVLANGDRSLVVGGTVGRVSASYHPRWEILDMNFPAMFDLPEESE
jgi:hypothetical protein